MQPICCLANCQSVSPLLNVLPNLLLNLLLNHQPRTRIILSFWSDACLLVALGILGIGGLFLENRSALEILPTEVASGLNQVASVEDH